MFMLIEMTVLLHYGP